MRKPKLIIGMKSASTSKPPIEIRTVEELNSYMGWNMKLEEFEEMTGPGVVLVPARRGVAVEHRPISVGVLKAGSR